MEGKSQELAKSRSIFTISRQKVKLLVLKLRHFRILHGSEVALFYEMPIPRVRSNVIGVARLCAKYVNTASEVKFHVQSGTDETKNIRHYFESQWRPEK